MSNWNDEISMHTHKKQKEIPSTGALTANCIPLFTEAGKTSLLMQHTLTGVHVNGHTVHLFVCCCYKHSAHNISTWLMQI